MKRLTIKTQLKREVIDITDTINDYLSDEHEELETGICHISILHTTAALTCADLDPGTDLDMLDAFEAMIPKLNYRHPHDPSHVPDHILSALVGTNITMPIKDGELVLGQWQRVVLMEFDGPRPRTITLTIIAERAD
jgi:secondary thiamine-phosphate synthase enzyme